MMHPSEIASGQQRAWRLLNKLGEGDAGEVYLVESILDKKTAILKRPRRSAFPSDIVRQAAQIEQEGRILTALTRLNGLNAPFRTPILLDQSEPGTGLTERYFIVVTQAPGINLDNLARLIHSGRIGEDISKNRAGEPSPVERRFFDGLLLFGKFPELLIMRTISGLIEFLEAIHLLEAGAATTLHSGILWNDVKPEHIYWDPGQVQFTIIDWGNAQFLEPDGTTKDRRFSRMDDFKQLVEEFGRFLSDISPDLHDRLAWPASALSAVAYTEGVLPIKERLADLLATEMAGLRQVRREEADLATASSLPGDILSKLGQIHNRIIAFGEIPDYNAAEKLLIRWAYNLILNRQFEEFQDLCNQALLYSADEPAKWRLLGQISDVVQAEGLPETALIAGLDGDWPAVMWALSDNDQPQTESSWWNDLTGHIRDLEGGTQTVRPFVALNRLVHTMQTAAQKNDTNQEHSQLLLILKDEIIPRWLELEPDPPHSGLPYQEVERLFDSIQRLVPEAGGEFVRVLEQPRFLMQIVLDAWERQDFDTARRGLRRLLLWDPERRRVLLADRAIQHTEAWLAEVHAGPGKDEPLTDFIARLELDGRGLLNQVGPAVWLESLLSAFRQIRKDNEPTHVLMDHPEVRDNLDWLLRLEPRRPILSSSGQPLVLERLPEQRERQPTLYGVKEAVIGQQGDLSLADPLDTWTPEARGSSARVFLAYLGKLSGEPRQVALKLMRPDRLEYAMPLFAEEARVLSLLQDVPGVVPMLESGYIRLAEGQQLPGEERHSSADAIQGQVVRYGLDAVHNFLIDLEKMTSQGWLPYLAIEKTERADNLLLLCDTGYTRGRFLPILEGLRLGIQICEILEAAHARNIIYRDHKILHYYWQAPHNGVFAIDWNIARRYPEGLSDSEIQFDLVQFGARALHYVLTGRPAPGALPLGPNRPEEIEAAARTYAVQWTYDDQRLPQDIKNVLEAVLTGSYTQAKRLREDLKQIFARLNSLVSNPDPVD